MSKEEAALSQRHAASATRGSTSRELPDELRLRTHFGALLAGEAEWAGKVLKGIESTAYEEIDCVGLQPDQSALYATIAVKQDTGYGGDLCTGPGNREYVRFFADWNGDGDFTDITEDLGVASVAVYDIPGPKPLSYTVAVTVPDHRRVCFLAGPVAVRAVLMYGSVPPPGNPHPNIHWGNVVDVHIQPQTRRLVLLDVLEQAKVHLPKQLIPLVDPHLEIGALHAPVPVEQLVHTYGGDVPLHRSLAPAISTVLGQLSHNAAVGTKLPTHFASVLPNEVLDKIDIGDIIGKYVATDGDTSFEQLHCVGMSQDLSAV
ncbi:MAG: hypothetical protein QOH99_179, partial [Frankiaceae bacterium]|nr:hypothetical protein [Frankiaceae bacterium]